MYEDRLGIRDQQHPSLTRALLCKASGLWVRRALDCHLLRNW